MGTTYVFLADGFEEVEALTVVDVLRRANVPVKTISVNEKKEGCGCASAVLSSHAVTVKADAVFDGYDFSDAEMLVLPGGMPGATHLREHEGLHSLLMKFHAEGKMIAAICAAPFVLGDYGILKGKKATCYPSFETHFQGAEYTARLVEKDGNVITGKGPGAAMSFAFAIAEHYVGKAKVDELKKSMIIE